MSNTINKPDANPVAAALLTVFFSLGHLLINGQQKKFIFTLLVTFIGGVLCCPGIFFAILSIMDAYQTAQRLQAGETIGENEYTQPLLFKIVRYLDSTATCSRA
jgi:TM2 domain-containing membrane protein YozV